MQEDTEIKKGDVVRQGEGGRLMNVTAVNGDMAYCTWMSETSQRCSGTFYVHGLTLANQEKRPVAGRPDRT